MSRLAVLMWTVPFVSVVLLFGSVAASTVLLPIFLPLVLLKLPG